MSRSADWMLIGVLVFGTLQTVACLFAPSFVSNWTHMDTKNSSTTTIVYSHGFNENPIKAEVQVKGDDGMIYPGIKSANVVKHGGKYVRAGVICLYNSTHVRIMGPPEQGNISSFIIYTGEPLKFWTGHKENKLKTGQVRVRVWRKSDLPYADETIRNVTMTSSQNYLKKRYNIKTKALYASVQLMFADGWIAEAQGSGSHFYANASAGWNGVVFAFGDYDVQLWVPPHNVNANGLVYTYYGWGNCTDMSNCMYTSVNATITLWGQSYVCDSVEFGNHNVKKRSLPHNSAGSLTINVDTDIIDVSATVTMTLNGAEKLYAFAGTGAAMMDRTNHSVGLVYGYNNNTHDIEIRHPLSCPNRHCHIVKVGNISEGSGVSIYACVWNGTRRTPSTTSVTSRPTTSSLTTSSSTSPLTTTSAMTSTTTSQPTVTTLTTSTTTKSPTTNTATVSTTTNQSTSSLTTSSTFNSSASGNAFKLCVFQGNNPRPCIDMIDLGRNVYIDLSQATPGEIGPGRILSMCKTGYMVESGDANRTINVEAGNISLSGKPLLCKERNPLHTKAEIEARVKEIVEKLTIPANTTSKHRRARESARDLRVASRVVGVVGGIVIGGLVILVVMSDAVRFIRYMCSK